MPDQDDPKTILSDSFDPATESPTAPQAILIGRKLGGRYLVERKLGEGGMGSVYLARDKPELHSRPVVIKVLNEKSLQNAWIVGKFQQEIESLTRLDDPGVVGIFDAGLLDNQSPYLVLQYVEGQTLRDALDRQGMDCRRVATIIRQIGASVSAAHDAGILHRDLKPENIMLRQTAAGEQVKIIDFGIAKVRDSVTSSHTETGRTFGTIGYMSPEQLRAEQLAPSSDVYALGIIAYEMLTGRRPFESESAVQLFEMQRAEVKPSDLRALPKNVANVISKALAFDPLKRFQRAEDFGEELAGALTEESSISAATQRMLDQQRGTKIDEACSKTAERVSENPGTESPQPLTLETAHVLLMDIVGYSKLLIDEQPRQLRELQDIVSNTEEFQRARAADRLLRLPTGDGMALVFFHDSEAAMRCALEIGHALRAHPEIQLRMGVHTGPVYRMADINANMNVAGGGINMAQRVMDCGDAGHITVSKRVADDLIQLSRWNKALHDLGEAEVKHGVRVHVYNFYEEGVGNAEVPAKLRSVHSRLIGRGRSKSALVPLVLVGVIVVAGAILALNRFWSQRPPGSAPNSSSLAPTSIVERSFRYSIEVQKYRGGKPYQKPYQIPGEINFEPDDRIHLWFSSADQGYLYLINKGPETTGPENCMILSPDNGRSALIEANHTVQLPPPSGRPEEDWIAFDKEAGAEQLWMIWSAQPIKIFEAVKKWSNPKDVGEIKDPAQEKAVRDFLIAHEASLPEGKRNREGTSTTVSGSGGAIVYRIILQHH